jgi:hypothetical protein
LRFSIIEKERYPPYKAITNDNTPITNTTTVVTVMIIEITFSGVYSSNPTLKDYASYREADA